ncbi:ShlB/FhaC/HecB family hemolysin secretion/activation protein [Marinomonas agarivorans]|nr:ShlB/FhaC/HecB family hemolysin secretion/activation protein [Marinomonas agarivorans]
MSATSAFAQTIPDSVDPGRLLEQFPQPSVSPLTLPSLVLPKNDLVNAPEGANDVSLVLQSVKITGMSAFDKNDVKHLYAEKLGQEVSADYIWQIASKLTKLYQENGFFLTRVLVPAQSIDNGNVQIDVIEGYIANIEFKGEYPIDGHIQSITEAILQQKPTNIKKLESQLLQLNDLFGVRFKSVLGKSSTDENGAVALILQQTDNREAEAAISTNNYGSQFVGPQRVNFSYESSLLPYQKTSITGMASVPDTGELTLGSLGHQVQINTSTTLTLSLSRTASAPGSTLSRSQLESNSTSGQIGMEWGLIRQRLENLRLSLQLNFLNSKTDTLGTALTRDRVRTIKFGGIYNFTDRFNGVNTIGLTLTRGLSLFNASEKNDKNLSRSDAAPEFTKLEARFSHQSYLSDNTALTLALQGQVASDSLYSSEEFGFGGINTGRAYDFSEITGDQGISALVELQYNGVASLSEYQVTPFVFYDFGKVWNKGSAVEEQVSAASAGIGGRIHEENGKGLNMDLTLATPLTKSIDTPLYKGDPDGVVARFSVNYRF